MTELWAQALSVTILLGVGYGLGVWQEWRHLRSLARREAAVAGMVVSNLSAVLDPGSVRRAFFVSGDAVIATDYFRSIAAELRNIVGGEVRAFERLMARARREAGARMLEQARRLGATEVWNVRFETSNVRSANRRNAAVSVEVFAFGTAVVRG